MHPRPRFLAIGIDAAEPSLVRRLMDRGEMPHLRALLDSGHWGEVLSPAHIGSAAVWPTFMTGVTPDDHGIFAIHPWDPQGMRVGSIFTEGITPFWADLAAQGHRVAVVDVPFGPSVGLPNVSEILEWGPHDRMYGRTVISPPALQTYMAAFAAHPLTSRGVNAEGAHDVAGLRYIADVCLRGVTMRGDLAVRLLADLDPDLLLLVFSEVHRSSHYLWHTADSSHPEHEMAVRRYEHRLADSLITIFREVDRQLGRIADAAGPEASILVFSLHGMRPTQGRPEILLPLLRRLGLAALQPWHVRTWPLARRQFLRAIRRAAPRALRRAYQKTAGIVPRIPLPQLVLSYDWARTRAFALPSDQHGWIRVNLRGREARGTVDPSGYGPLLDGLERAIRALASPEGIPVASRIFRPGGNGGAVPDHLPDLIVHWNPAAMRGGTRMAASGLTATIEDTRFTGQHDLQGFFIFRAGRRAAVDPGRAIAGHDIHRLIRQALVGDMVVAASDP